MTLTLTNLGQYLLWVSTCAMLLQSHGRAGDAAMEKLFTLKVKASLSEKCFACHGGQGDKIKGGFDLTSRETLLKGGKTISRILVPGSPNESFLLTAVRWEDPDYEMPPKANDRLTAEQINDLEKWIAAGAPWPTEERQAEIRKEEQTVRQTEDGLLVDTSGGQSEEWTFRRYQPADVWAFQPLSIPDVPKNGEAHPIDAFIGERLKKAGLAINSNATPRTLIRRAYYDLTGLPPQPEAVSSFTRAYAEDPATAWESLLQKLTASQHYGERWAQHWLDVARYADTGGFSNDYERSNAWRYRDYVVRSFNEDKRYDEFILEQLAGDELADQSLRTRSETEKAFHQARQAGAYTQEESEKLVASSFLRMGPFDPAMVKAPEARQLYIDDVVNSVGQTFLSMTMRCFKCHDHKFDPLPTKDYYRFYAAFAATQLAERPAPFLDDENTDAFDGNKALSKTLLRYAREKKTGLVEKRENAAKEWYRAHNKDYVSHTDRKNLPDDEKPPRHVGLDYIDEGRLKVREQDEWIWNRRLERYEPMVQSVYNGPDPKFLNARKLRMAANPNMAWRPDSRILEGGALQAPGDPVGPGVLSAIAIPTGLKAADPYALPDEIEGRRLALAKWIANPRNPLTARSIVNRVWQHHFGQPLAGNPNNFGAKGKKPTHPELLDWLAKNFMDNGWTFKRLHRLIMTSKAYQQGPTRDDLEAVLEIDPDNELLAYYPHRRLTAEELRDSMLAVSGELNPGIGGLPIMPDMNLEVALQPRMIQFSIAPAYQPSLTPEERNRRSLYVYRVRGLADPFLESFNQPSPNDSCEMRDSASVSPQAFTLLNSDLVSDRSIAFARRLETEAKTIENRIDRAFHLAFSRPARATELEKLSAYVKEMQVYHQAHPPEERTYPTSITRSLVEEFSGKPFEYTEILPAYERYQRNLEPADVNAHTRALADLCTLLFNSHEFLFLY